MNYDSPRQIAALLDERGLSLKKRFGQNFLISPGARRKIVSLLAAGRDETVWEIGAGIGSMTQLVVDSVERLIIFEIDHGLVRMLEESFADKPHLVIVAGDYLKTWEDASASLGRPDAVFGNLPYRTAAGILASLTRWKPTVGRAVFTVQREVARRLAASPATKDYSRLSVVCQSVFAVRLHGDLAAASFYPMPEVVSTIVGFSRREPQPSYDRELFDIVVRDLFSSRRKTAKKNLLSGAAGRRFGTSRIERAISEASIPAKWRGEELSTLQVADLVRALQSEGPAQSDLR